MVGMATKFTTNATMPLSSSFLPYLSAIKALVISLRERKEKKQIKRFLSFLQCFHTATFDVIGNKMVFVYVYVLETIVMNLQRVFNLLYV